MISIQAVSPLTHCSYLFNKIPSATTQSFGTAPTPPTPRRLGWVPTSANRKVDTLELDTIQKLPDRVRNTKLALKSNEH